MSRVDTAWLRMERPTNPMMITGVLMFAEPMSLAQLEDQVIQQRFLAYAVSGRSRSTVPPAPVVEDETFDLDWHVRLSGLPGKPGKTAAEKKALERFVSHLASSPLDADQAAWQFHLVERYQGGSALVARIPHCYADGIALVRVCCR